MDLVALGELPASVRQSIAAYVGCVAGVSRKDEYIALLRAAGFGATQHWTDERGWFAVFWASA